METKGRTLMARKNHATEQTFSITAPAAMSVQLVGDFTHWQQQPIAMKKGPDGVWKTTVELTPGTHHYRFLVDGQWRDDPECALHVPNEFGSQNAVRQVA
jgi:1,4-alpha-glucan branching enzyme